MENGFKILGGGATITYLHAILILIATWLVLIVFNKIISDKCSIELGENEMETILEVKKLKKRLGKDMYDHHIKKS